MMRIFTALLTSLLFTCLGFAEEVSFLKGWMDNIEAAKQVAKERQCSLLVAFLGPNWCAFSDKLEEEVLSQEAFRGILKEEFVFVKIDIPENFEEIDYYGKDLKEKFHVSECPCLVIASNQAEAIAKLDYLPVKHEHFARYVMQVIGDYDRVSHLAKRELRQMKVDELKHLYHRAGHLADATFKQALMKQGLKIDRGPFFLVEEYGDMLASGKASDWQLRRIRNKVLSRDRNNEQGCLRKMALIDFESKVSAKTPEQVIEPLVSYLKQFGMKDEENAWKLEMKISQYLFSKNQIDEALKHAKLSFDAAPKEARQEVAQSIEYLKTFVR